MTTKQITNNANTRIPYIYMNACALLRSYKNEIAKFIEFRAKINSKQIAKLHYTPFPLL